MPNYLPKGRELMRELCRRGGQKSGRARRDTADELHILRIVVFGAIPVEEAWNSTPAELIERATKASRRGRSGGSHDTDWRCPHCHHYNHIERHSCAKCHEFAPANDRLTRAALRDRAEEHRTQAILRKYE